MRKTIVLAILSLCLTALTVGVSAVSPEEAETAAEILHDLGLFRGTGTASDGAPVYDLDRVPTRDQAVIMLVRLLGREDEALSGDWELPFTDVTPGSLSSHYIGYAWTNGLTKGVTETTFHGTDPVTRDQYLLFLMRVMRYDMGSMRPAEAADQARTLYVLRDADGDGPFTRGDLAVLTLRALDAYMYWVDGSQEAGGAPVATLRERLGLGRSPGLARPVPLTAVQFESYEDAIGRIRSGGDGIEILEEIPVSGGTLVSYQYRDRIVEPALGLYYEDGTRIGLPLPWKTNRNSDPNAAPEDLRYDAGTGTVTYTVTVEEPLATLPQAMLRRAGTYRYTVDVAARTAFVEELTGVGPADTQESAA